LYKHLHIVTVDVAAATAEWLRLLTVRTVTQWTITVLPMLDRQHIVHVDEDYLKFVEKLENVEPEVIPTPETFLEEIEAREKQMKGE